MSDASTARRGDKGHHARETACEYVTAMIGGQWCGIPVLKVQDVLGPQRITRIPLAPGEVAGSLNLRGRIVTSIDLRARLRLEPGDHGKSMSIVVENHGELYSLMVDSVGEVLAVPAHAIERNPATLDQTWRGVSDGVHRLEKGIVVLLNVDSLLEFANRQSVAA
ncbi:MAG: chemotaxis protein CheW [Rhodospirillales bacterium]